MPDDAYDLDGMGDPNCPVDLVPMVAKGVAEDGPLDPAGAWKMRLAQKISELNIPVEWSALGKG